MVTKRSRIFKLANIYQILTDVQRILLITVIDMRTRNLDELDMRKIIVCGRQLINTGKL
jgi:hypothetical protein